MNVEIVSLESRPAIMLYHIGPYDQIAPRFQELSKWVEANHIPATEWIGIYFDNPEHTPANKLRSAACAVLPRGYHVTAPNMPGKIGVIAGGLYATTNYVGPYEDLEPVWAEFTREIERKLRKRILQETPGFEIYHSDPGTTEPAQLSTSLYMPVHAD